MKQSACNQSRIFHFVRQWTRIWFVPIYLGIILTFGWFNQWDAANFCQWFLLICLAILDLLRRFNCESVSTCKGSDYSPSLLDRLTFRECGLTLWLGCLLPVPVWVLALGLGISFYRLN